MLREIITCTDTNCIDSLQRDSYLPTLHDGSEMNVFLSSFRLFLPFSLVLYVDILLFIFFFFSHSIEHHILDMLFERNHSLPLNRIDWSTYVVYVCVWARSFQNKLLVEWLVAVLFGYTMKKVEDSSGEMTFSASIRENQREARERENYSKIIINRFWLFSFPIVASASTKFRWYPVICCIFFSICGKHNTEM